MASLGGHFRVEREGHQAEALAKLEYWSGVLRREVVDLPSLVAFATSRTVPHDYGWPGYAGRGVVLAALGKFDEARQELARAWPWFLSLDARTQNSPGTRRRFEGLRDLHHALDGDPRAVFKMLHEWEATNVREGGFEAHWTPSPFPGEIAMGLVEPPEGGSAA